MRLLRAKRKKTVQQSHRLLKTIRFKTARKFKKHHLSLRNHRKCVWSFADERLGFCWEGTCKADIFWFPSLVAWLKTPLDNRGRNKRRTMKVFTKVKKGCEIQTWNNKCNKISKQNRLTNEKHVAKSEIHYHHREQQNHYIKVGNGQQCASYCASHNCTNPI